MRLVIILFCIYGFLESSSYAIYEYKENEKAKDNLIDAIVNTMTELTEVNKIKILIKLFTYN